MGFPRNKDVFGGNSAVKFANVAKLDVAKIFPSFIRAYQKLAQLPDGSYKITRCMVAH